jgi:hypothetical protein
LHLWKLTATLRKGAVMRKGSLSRFAVLPTIAFVSQISCGDRESTPCPGACPASYLGIVLTVTAAAGGGVPTGVEATLSGPATETLSCDPTGTAVSCTWRSGTPTAGSYSLQVAAPGFQTANVNATIAETPDPRCGCTWATIKPSVVTLDPS